MAKMRDGRKFFVVLTSVIAFLYLFGTGCMMLGEFSARAALPPDMRTTEMIQRNFDGAVCLGCEMGRFFFFFGGFFAFLFIFASWGIYELAILSGSRRGAN